MADAHPSLPSFFLAPLPALLTAKDAVLELDKRHREAIRRIDRSLCAVIEVADDASPDAAAEWLYDVARVAIEEHTWVSVMAKDARLKLDACSNNLLEARVRPANGSDNAVTIRGGRYESYHHYVVGWAECWCLLMDHATKPIDCKQLADANPPERIFGVSGLKTNIELESAAARRYVEEREAMAMRERQRAAGHDADPAQVQTPDNGPAPQPGKLEWLARAMLTVREHPERSDTAIANSVGKSPSTLSRSAEYQAAAGIARAGIDAPPKGFRTSGGGIESVAPNGD